MKNIKSFKVNTSNLITGNSEINHRIRVKLGLGFVDYCVLEYIDKVQYIAKVYKKETIWKNLGIDKPSFDKSVKLLLDKKLLYKTKDNIIRTANKWSQIDCGYINEEFGRFWNFNINGKTEQLWKGPKKNALKEFKKTRKHRTFEYIMDQKTWYYKLLQIESYRSIMRADKFLSTDTGQIDEDFKSQVLFHQRKENPKNKQVMNKEQYELAYASTNK